MRYLKNYNEIQLTINIMDLNNPNVLEQSRG